MPSDKPQIRVTEAQRAELHDRKQPGESYADVLDRLLDGDQSTESKGHESGEAAP